MPKAKISGGSGPMETETFPAPVFCTWILADSARIHTIVRRRKYDFNEFRQAFLNVSLYKLAVDYAPTTTKKICEILVGRVVWN